jgi:hypothetical protein
MSGQRKGPGSKEFLLNVGYGRLEASTIKSLDDLNWVDGEEDEVLVSFAHGRASFRLYPAVLSSTNDAMVFCFEDGRQRQSSTVYSPAILLSLTHLLNICWCLNGHRLRPHTCFYCLTRASFRTPQTQSLGWTSWFQHLLAISVSLSLLQSLAGVMGGTVCSTPAGSLLSLTSVTVGYAVATWTLHSTDMRAPLIPAVEWNGGQQQSAAAAA